MRDREKLRAQREHSRNGILAEIALALTPGSPAYVKRLRDQAAVAIYAAIVSNPQRSQDDMEPIFDWQIYRESAVEEANLTIAALGYQVPGEEGEERDRDLIREERARGYVEELVQSYTEEEPDHE